MQTKASTTPAKKKVVIDIKVKVGISKKGLEVIQRFAQKKRMKQQFLSMNEIAFRAGDISEEKYQEIKDKLQGADHG